MQRIKFFTVAAMLVLVAGAVFSSQAQKRMANHKVPIPPTPVVGILEGRYVTTVEGTEVDPGQLDNMSNQVYGWTSYTKATGDLEGYMFMSLNYGAPTPSNSDAVLPGLLPPATCQVIGGSWTKIIFVDGVYTGSISGRIVSGTVDWNAGGQIATLNLQVSSDTATDGYEGSLGTGQFQGIVDRTATPTASMTGTLTLNY